MYINELRKKASKKRGPCNHLTINSLLIDAGKLPIRVTQVFLVLVGDLVIDLYRTDVFPITVLQISFGLIGHIDFYAIEIGLLKRENRVIGGRDFKASFAGFPRLDHERAVLIGNNGRQGLSLGINGKMVDIDEIAIFVDIDPDVGFGIAAIRPVLDLIFGLIKTI